MDTTLRAVVAAVLGLAIGSFLTVVVDRVPEKESIVSPRSRCPHCGARSATATHPRAVVADPPAEMSLV